MTAIRWLSKYHQFCSLQRLLPRHAFHYCTQLKSDKSRSSECHKSDAGHESLENAPSNLTAVDLDALKNEMFEDFESEKDQMHSNDSDSLESLHRMEEIDPNEEITEDNLDQFDVFEHGEDRLSFAAKQFKKRMEFNESLKKASRVKSTKDVQYTSATLSAGIPELLYDAEGLDYWVNILRLYTYTPFTIGMIFVPIAIYGFPDWELFPKLMFGAFYMSTSALFPYFSYRAARDKVNKAWLTPDCNKVIIEKMNFFFQPFKQEYLIKDLRVLHHKGQDTHCWFQCKKTKHQFLFVSELMQHSVWLQLLGVDDEAIATAKMANIANDGKVTMFRGSLR